MTWQGSAGQPPSQTAPDEVRPGGPTILEPDDARCLDVGARRGATATRRQSRHEYVTSLRQIFGARVLEGIAVVVEGVPGDDPEVKQSPGSFDPGMGKARVTYLFELSHRVAREVAASDEALRAIGDGCLVDNLDEACARGLAASLGRRMLKRDLSAAEIDAHLTAWSSDEPGLSAPRERLEATLASLLNDPEYLFLVASRAPGGDALDPHAVAWRLSHMVWGGPPDDDLLRAAQDGALAQASERELHARRLLDSPQGRAHVRALFDRWLALEREVNLNPSAPQLGLEVDKLYDELRGEALDFVEHVIFEQRGSYRDLMTSPLEFPRSERLASLLGYDRVHQEAQTSTTGRAGLLARPALLVHVYDRPAPIHRAVHVMYRGLCRTLSVPDNANDVANMRLDEIEDQSALSSRAIAERVTAGECQACHAQINPLGFALSGFGALGEPWEQEIVYDHNKADGSVLRRLAVDARVDLTLDGVTTSVDGAEGLGEAIATSEEGQACAARQLFRVTHLREPEPADACHVGELAEAVAMETPIFDILIRNAVDRPSSLPHEEE